MSPPYTSTDRFSKPWPTSKFLWSIIVCLLIVFVAYLLPRQWTIAGPFSLLPPVAAIAFAVLWKRVLPALAAGILAGALLLHNLNPISSVSATAFEFIGQSAISLENLYIYAFTLLLVAMVGITIKAGAVNSLVFKFSKWAASRRATQVLVSILGYVIFFDDYANTMVVGTATRPLIDRSGVSREKLAYLVDSTAAPIASLALISTWIGIEIRYLDQQMAQLRQFASSGYGIFLLLIPLRFYCIFALIHVFVVAITGRDYGPMFKAETRAWDKLQTSGHKPPEVSGDYGKSASASKLQKPAPWWAVVFPVVSVVVFILTSFFIEGDSKLPRALSLVSLNDWRAAFCAVENTGLLLTLASVVGTAVAIVLSLYFSSLQLFEIFKAALDAMKNMLPAIALLVLAQALRKVTDSQHLQTAEYIVSMLSGVPATFIPIAIFVSAALVAFATGTSWGTMGILLPVAVPLAANTVAAEQADYILVLLATGAVLDGAVFGDHCSPISDTTVLSSIGSSCNHLEHVRTQLPYAVTAMTAAALAGYLIIPVIDPPILLCYTLGTIICIVTVFTLGRVPEQERPLR